eukprot:Gregarina_sp_Poly_1__4173@NODE_2285_length_2360_cov_53_272569_g1072_i1_p1_GENE_NODE_2285_length_2360_cov_53_272569_g1072_i1NODE_2285_length_2360_cov_53_272569_g1072_i1_p1_ORF_typecomplete_len318_score29_70DUF1129/PF06570_11/0_35_NODE_2285_length_2360_cov_53_272569_g1072_i110902043
MIPAFAAYWEVYGAVACFGVIGAGSLFPLPALEGEKAEQAELFPGLAYRWIQTLEAQIPLVALLCGLFAAVHHDDATISFIGFVNIHESSLLRWAFCNALIGFVYNAVQYQQPDGVLRKPFRSILWSTLAFVTLSASMFHVDAVVTSYAKWGYIVVGALNCIIALLWITAFTPVDKHSTRDLPITHEMEPLNATLLSEISPPKHAPGGYSQPCMQEGGILSQWFFGFATPYFQKDCEDVNDLPPPKPEEQLSVQLSLFEENIAPEKFSLGKTCWHFMKHNLLLNTAAYFIGIQFQLLAPLVLNRFFECLQQYASHKY